MPGCADDGPPSPAPSAKTRIPIDQNSGRQTLPWPKGKDTGRDKTIHADEPLGKAEGRRGARPRALDEKDRGAHRKERLHRRARDRAEQDEAHDQGAKQAALRGEGRMRRQGALRGRVPPRRARPVLPVRAQAVHEPLRAVRVPHHMPPPGVAAPRVQRMREEAGVQVPRTRAAGVRRLGGGRLGKGEEERVEVRDRHDAR